jgi:hypothetical protein
MLVSNCRAAAKSSCWLSYQQPWLSGVSQPSGSWQETPRYVSLPRSSRPAQHVYILDDGSIASVYPDQRLEFDIGNMDQWSRPRISAGSHIVQLSSTGLRVTYIW